MKKLLIFILAAFMLTSCSEKANQPLDMESESEKEEISGIEEIESELEEDDPNKIVSPLDGLKYYPEELSLRPVAVSLDNHPRARWQAGLKDAEIVYEFQVEFPYTRYLAIYLAKQPEMVGPVRSARPYIIYYALENDGIFVHVGGSEDAFSEIKRLQAAEIDGLYSGAMWRYNDTGKYAPHNMYTTLKSIRDEAKRLGFRTEASFEKYNFSEAGSKLSVKYKDSFKANKINIEYNKDNTTDYTYNKDSKLYLRFKDKEEHIDELYKEQLTAKNIIVLEQPKSVLDSVGRLYLESIGTGKGIYFTEGEGILITWTKKSEKDRTRFYINDTELKLNPGNTWIQIVDSVESVTNE
ncbi:DUF3048 domain-containing protein [Sedimentibacter sp.]|uniref:DUF3048 domain-containing protein n=1 Tax=Sedimentibacter sp. TaxID=1960295 RepID=UPI00289ACEB2|nr:DUF3048 domain-containing protein [Sedimentibacter sp.]